MPKYISQFELSNLNLGTKKLSQIDNGLNLVYRKLVNSFSEYSFIVSANISEDIYSFNYLTPDATSIYFLAFKTQGEVIEISLQLTSFSTPIKGLEEHIKSVACEAVHFEH